MLDGLGDAVAEMVLEQAEGNRLRARVPAETWVSTSMQ